MNKREMYNRIMSKVAVEVKKALNESEGLVSAWFNVRCDDRHEAGQIGLALCDKGIQANADYSMGDYNVEVTIYDRKELEEFADIMGYSVDTLIAAAELDKEAEEFLQDNGIWNMTFVDANVLELPGVRNAIVESLNESFAFEHDAIGDKILDVLKDSKIAPVVKDATLDDMIDLICAMKENLNDTDVPGRITNLKALAQYINYKLGNEIAAGLKKLSGKELDELAKYVADQHVPEEAAPKTIANRAGMQPVVKECDCKDGKCDCKDGKCDCKTPVKECGEKKAVTESYQVRRRKFYKSL